MHEVTFPTRPSPRPRQRPTRRRPGRWTLALATAAAVLVASIVPGGARAAPARAAGSPKASPAAARAEATARAHFQRAERAFDLGKFEEALEAYEAAYEAKALPGFLFNIAQCHRNLGNGERAVFFYQRYLALDPATPNRKLVEELMAAEQERLEQSRPPAVAPTPEPPPGPPAPPRDDLAAPPPAPTPEPLALRDAGPAPDRPGRFYTRWWFWTAVGVAVVGGTVAVLATRPRAPTGALETIDLRGGR
jgi:hypothetical protein